LIEGLRNEVIVRTNTAKELFPDIHTDDYRMAVRHALDTMEAGKVETIWSDALASSQGDLPPVYFTQEQGLIIERRQQTISVRPEVVFRIFTGLGGKRGWLAYNLAWQLRGIMDRLVGGVGMRRGRRHPDELRVGDAVDFWRVEAIESDRMLRLRAEMKVPGKAWLQLVANPTLDGQTLLVQTAFFEPKGLFGVLYWYVLYPIHALIFGTMVQKIRDRAEATTAVAFQAGAGSD
jgi:hypothetical protein